MRSTVHVLLAALLGYGVSYLQPSLTSAALTPAVPTRPIQAYFSPNGGCTEAIVTEIDAAKVSLEVQAYSFTSAPIAKAVADAHARGVKVRVILDKSQDTEKYSSLTFLQNAQVPTRVDRKHAIAHNKIMIIDRKTLLTGSFNFTKNAEKSNAENLLVINDQPELIAAYEKNFEEHLGHSVE